MLVSIRTCLETCIDTGTNIGIETSSETSYRTSYKPVPNHSSTGSQTNLQQSHIRMQMVPEDQSFHLELN